MPEFHTTLSCAKLQALYDLSLKKNNGRLIVHGIFARGNVRNTNGRVYPQSVLKREVRKFKRSHIKVGTALGELDHPSYSSCYFRFLNIANISHQVLEVHWKNNTLWGTLEILPTPSGLLLWELYSRGIRLGVSSRGWASQVQDVRTQAMRVDEDFELFTFDFVTEPSTDGAYLVPIQSTYRGFIPDQSRCVEAAFLGYGAIAFSRVHRFPSLTELQHRIQTAKAEHKILLASGATPAAAFVVPTSPSMSLAVKVVEGPLLPWQQHRAPRQESLTLSSHYLVHEDDQSVAVEPHHRKYKQHVAQFVQKAHSLEEERSKMEVPIRPLAMNG